MWFSLAVVCSTIFSEQFSIIFPITEVIEKQTRACRKDLDMYRVLIVLHNRRYGSQSLLIGHVLPISFSNRNHQREMSCGARYFLPNNGTSWSENLGMSDQGRPQTTAWADLSETPGFWPATGDGCGAPPGAGS